MGKKIREKDRWLKDKSCCTETQNISQENSSFSFTHLFLPYVPLGPPQRALQCDTVGKCTSSLPYFSLTDLMRGGSGTSIDMQMLV